MSEGASQMIVELMNTPEPPGLGPERRPGVQSEAELNRMVTEALRAAEVSAERKELVRAVVLLWHDHLEAAHGISQSIDTTDGAFVHGIVHRREPDYGNAAYWFRRVGRHPAFPELAERVGRLLAGEGQEPLRPGLLGGGKWDAFGFIEACREASSAAGAGQGGLLRRVQAIELGVLAEWFCRDQSDRSGESDQSD